MIEHLIKIFLYPNHKEFTQGWAKEVYAAFHQVSTMKRTNDYPEPDEIVNSLFQYSKSEFRIVIQSVISSNTEISPFDVSAEEIQTAVVSVLNKEASILSNRGKITMSEVFRCINKHLKNSIIPILTK